MTRKSVRFMVVSIKICSVIIFDENTLLRNFTAGPLDVDVSIEVLSMGPVSEIDMVSAKKGQICHLQLRYYFKNVFHFQCISEVTHASRHIVFLKLRELRQ